MFSRQTFLNTWIFKQFLIFVNFVNNFKCFEKEHFLGSSEHFFKAQTYQKVWIFWKRKQIEILFILNKTHTRCLQLKKDWWCPHHEAWSWESRRDVLRWRLLRLSTIMRWKRSGVSIFSGIYRGSKSFASIARRLWWVHLSEDLSAQSL